MVQGSLEPSLVLTLSGEAGPAPLSQAAKVEVRGELHDTELFMREVSGPFDDDGVVEMDWLLGDTDTPGRIWIDAKVTWSGVGARPQWFRSADIVDVEAL